MIFHTFLILGMALYRQEKWVYSKYEIPLWWCHPRRSNVFLPGSNVFLSNDYWWSISNGQNRSLSTVRPSPPCSSSSLLSRWCKNAQRTVWRWVLTWGEECGLFCRKNAPRAHPSRCFTPSLNNFLCLSTSNQRVDQQTLKSGKNLVGVKHHQFSCATMY